MNTNAAFAVLALSLSTLGGCALDGDVDLEGGEEFEVEYSQAESDVTICTAPSIMAAAITMQSSRVNDPIVDMKILTISPTPYRWLIANVTGGPSTASIFSKSTTCTQPQPGQWRCYHSFSISPGTSCYASGNYVLTVQSASDSGTCLGGLVGSVQTIPFSIQTENMCSHDFDGVPDGY